MRSLAAKEFNDSDKYQTYKTWTYVGYGVGAGLAALGTGLLIWGAGNRLFDRRVAITPERVGETLKQPMVATIPFEDRIISNSVNRGIPFVTENKNLLSSKAIQSLADLIREKSKPETDQEAL